MLDKDIKELLSYLLRYKKKNLLNFQELLFNILRVTSTPKFLKEIEGIRKNLKMPSFAGNPSNDKQSDALFEWMINNKKAPQSPIDDRIVKLCLKYKLNPLRYGEFVWGYLCDGGIIPYKPTLGDFLFKEESKFKTRLELEYKGYSTIINGAYIRIFKDTTKGKLKDFIDQNWTYIKEVQKNIPIYPINRIYKQSHTFNIILFVYLLRGLRNSYKKIQEQITKEFKIYLDDSTIRKYVSDFKKKISLSSGVIK